MAYILEFIIFINLSRFYLFGRFIFLFFQINLGRQIGCAIFVTGNFWIGKIFRKNP